MKIPLSKDKCCGCGACMNACPIGAIRMVDDTEGFAYPHIDQDVCVECGACEDVCRFQTPPSGDSTLRAAFSLRANDRGVLRNSTSGGAFTALSDVVLGMGGAICGSVLEEDFTVRHVLACSAEQRDAMRGSKYVQSDMSSVFKEIEGVLKGGKSVLFTGCPCQVDALRSYLERAYDNLYLVEFLCHGVPSNQLFKDHVACLEGIAGKKAVSYSWRSKKYGWHPNYIEGIAFSDGSADFSTDVQRFVKLFWSGVSLRPSCYECRYRNHHRCADVTIADFWGIEKLTGKPDVKGVSLVIPNTQKGEEIVGQIDRGRFSMTEYPVKDVLGRISTKPSRRPNQRERFWSLYESRGYAKASESLYPGSIIGKLKHGLKRAVRSLSVRMGK